MSKLVYNLDYRQHVGDLRNPSAPRSYLTADSLEEYHCTGTRTSTAFLLLFTKRSCEVSFELFHS